MKRFAKLLSLLILAGCGGNETATVSSHGSVESGSDAHVPQVPQVNEPELHGREATAAAAESDRSFGAGDKATLVVPTMTCRMCYKKIQKALIKVEGITQIDLVPQHDEDRVNDPRVTLQFAGPVSKSQAIAALDEIGYPNAQFDASESGVSATK